jgi:raffinose/stachyose/melibiose transport system substrate-binding protein
VSRRRALLVGLVATALLASSCGGSDDDDEAQPDTSSIATDEAAPAASDGTEASDAPVATEATDEAVTLTMGSWRSDDVKQMETLLAALHEAHPNITVSFEPTLNTEYNPALRTSLDTGTGPDLFYVRSYAAGRQLYDEGFIEPLTDVGLDTWFTEASLDPWASEGVPYALPFIAVSHGFYYNKDIFAEAGVEVPETWDELLAVAATLDEAGVIPFANASGDEWTMAEMLFMNFAPSFIGGRDGRLAYETGAKCFDDPQLVSVFQALSDIAPYLPDGQEALTYADSQQLWLQGEAAMWIGGSWDIPYFETEEPPFEWSEFQVPTPEGGVKAVAFHLDAGIGINAASEHKDAAKTVIEWLASDEAAAMMAAELPGFFPIQKNPPTIADPHAAEFLSWNADSELDVRFVWPVLSDGTPDGYTLVQAGAVGVVNGTMTPEEAATSLQEGLAEWYEPAQTCGG